jgi:hypothetical protein
MTDTRSSAALGLVRSVASAAVFFVAGCQGHATVLDAGGRNADPALVASLSVDPAASIADVTLSDSAYVAVFRWRAPSGFQLIAPDRTSGEGARLGPGEYIIGTGDTEDSADTPAARRILMILIASRRPLDTSAWGAQIGAVGPDARVVTRRSAMAWLVENVVDAPDTTAWLMVESHAARPAGRVVAQRGPGPALPHPDIFTPATRRGVDRTGRAPGASQPERSPD